MALVNLGDQSTGAATMFGSALDFAGNIYANSASRNQAIENRHWMETQSRRAHEFEVADLKRAGLNPVLSAGGSGMQSGTPPMSTFRNPFEGAGEKINSAFTSLQQRKVMDSQINEIDQRVKNLQQEKLKTYVDTLAQNVESVSRANLNSALGEKALAEAEVSKSEIPRISEQTKNLAMSSQVMSAQQKKLVEETFSAMVDNLPARADPLTVGFLNYIKQFIPSILFGIGQGGKRK